MERRGGRRGGRQEQNEHEDEHQDKAGDKDERDILRSNKNYTRTYLIKVKRDFIRAKGDLEISILLRDHRSTPFDSFGNRKKITATEISNLKVCDWGQLW